MIKKEKISSLIKYDSYTSYLYIIIKNLNNEIIYNNIEGQFLFFSMDYIYSPIPENFSIFSHIEEGQNIPYSHTIKMIREKDALIEF